MAPNTPNKPASRNWNDIQMFLAALSMALTLGLWNLFASPDQALAKEKAGTTEPQPVSEQPTVTAAPAALPQVKIYLGGVAPQTQITVTNIRRGGGGASLPGGGGGGGGGGGTGSS